MKHDGLFAQHDQWAGIVVSLHAATVFFEHPKPKLPLPDDAREALHRLPRFDLLRSWMHWPSKTPRLDRRIAGAQRQLRTLAKIARSAL